MRKMSLSEQITYSTVLIKCRYKDSASGSGTGFIMNLCQEKNPDSCIPVVITNRHVIKNSIEIIFELCMADNENNPIDTKTMSITTTEDLWIPHPDDNIDLCCFPLAPKLIEMQQDNINVFYIPLETSLIPTEESLSKFTAIEDVVMVGYPKGLSDTYNHKPIIRSGSTSSHPRMDYQGKKETLLDIAAWPGSSGSPVFIMNNGSYPTDNGITIGSRLMLLGVLYSGPTFDALGRLQFAELPTIPVTITSIPINLGVIIKAYQILEFETCFKHCDTDTDV